jgi:hypothetical protein
MRLILLAASCIATLSAPSRGEERTVSLRRGSARQHALEADAGAYSIRSAITIGERGLHEYSVMGALRGDHVALEGAASPIKTKPGAGAMAAATEAERLATPIGSAWEAFAPALARASGLSCPSNKERVHWDGNLDASPRTCLTWLSEALEEGVVEPDKLECPGTPQRAQMTWQAAFAHRGAHNPLCTCRTAIQVWHSSALPLVASQAYLPRGKSAPDPFSLDDSDIQKQENWARERLLVAPLDNRQARSAIVATIVSAVAEAALRSDMRLAARILGAALHALGDSFSASHTRRADRRWTPSRDALNSLQACAGGRQAGGERLSQFFSMDVVRWMDHVSADIDRTSEEEGAPLFRCAKFAIDALIAAWMRARSAGGGGGEQPPSRDALNALVRDSASVVCTALDMAPITLAQPAGGASDRWSSANTLAVEGGWETFKNLVGAAFSPKQGRSFMPAALMDEEDFQAHARSLDDMVVVFRAAAAKGSAAERNRIPERLWVPRRGWDACAAPEVLDFDDIEYDEAVARGKLPAAPEDTYLTLAGRARPFMLSELGEPVAEGSKRWKEAERRIGKCEDVDTRWAAEPAL